MSRLTRWGVPLYGQSTREPLSRRTVLRGLLRGAVVSVALPPLELFFNGNGTAYACGGVIPRRFGLYFWGNGNVPSAWVPKGEGTSWQLSSELAPLVNVQDQISVVSGMSLKLENAVPHSSGLAGMLTGVELAPVGSDWTPGGPTIDQIIAQQISAGTLYKSLQTAATDIGGQSWNGPSSNNPAEISPYAFYERIFGASFREPGSDGTVDPTLALRSSVLDAVSTDFTALRKRVGASDRARLDQHMEGIRELESRLAQLQEDPPDLEACARPGKPLTDYPDEEGRPQISVRSRAMVDMLAMALACDQTRVFGHYIDEPVGNTLFPDTTDGHHSLTHDEPEPQPQVDMITTAIMTEYAYLVEKFASIVEADGTLLDNCAVLACSEVSEGRTHSLDDMPIVIAGKACGALKTGVHYRSYSQENASKVLLTLVRAMDIPAASFGEGVMESTEGLSEIEA